MPRKEKINAKTWERDRRNRMNTYFKTLSDLLPPYQEGRKRNKVDILIHASKYIKELNGRTEELFNTHAGEAHKEELRRLKKLVTQLFSRTQLLSTLLRDAGITVPAEPALEKISPLKWSNKINVEDGEKYLDRLTECKKPDKRNKSMQMGYKVPSKQKSVSLDSGSPKKGAEAKTTPECANGPIEDQENHVNSSINESGETRDSTGTANKSVNSNTHNAPDPPHDVTMSPLESSCAKPSKGIRKLESRKKVKRKGKLIDLKIKKKKKSNVSSSQSQSITNLLPGTLIWSAGKIMPLVTPITPLTPNILVSAQAQPANPIILSNAQQNQMIVMQPLSNRVQNSVLPMRSQTLVKAVQKVALPNIQTSVGINSRDWASNVKNIIESTKIGGRKGILPKGKEITTTTMAYKVPIPAIHREPIKNKIHEIAEPDSKGKSKKSSKSKKIQPRDKIESETKDKKNSSKIASVVTITNSEKIAEAPKSAETTDRKRKAIEEPEIAETLQPKLIKTTKLPETCKSIENLRHVVERIGEETSEAVETPKTQEVESIPIESPADNSTALADPIGEDSKASEVENIPETKDCVETVNKPTPAQPETNLNSSGDSNKDPSPVSLINAEESSPLVENKLSNASTSDVDIPANSEATKSSPEPRNEQPTEVTDLTEVDEAVAEVGSVSEKEKTVCDLGSRFDSLLRATEKTEVVVDSNTIIDNAKIILNLDTNTTTTLKPDIPTVVESLNSETSVLEASAVVEQKVEEVAKVVERTKDESLKSLSYSANNSFVPIGNRAEGLHSDLSNDLFASLQVPSSSHNPESISPTAAFLMAFPLVSSLNGKTEVLEEEMKEDLKYHSQTPPMLLQIGAIEPNSFKVKPDTAVTALSAEKLDNCQQRDVNKSQTVPKVSSVPATKALPKIVNNETIKDRLYKVVQYPEPPVSTTSNSNFAVTSTNARSNSDSSTITIPTCAVQSTPIIQNSSSVTNVLDSSPAKCENPARKCETQSQSASCSKFSGINSISSRVPAAGNPSELPKYDSIARYPSIPDYVPGYANFSAANANQPRTSFAMSKTAPGSSSQVSATLPAVSESAIYPSMRSQAVQSAYVAHTTGKDPQTSQQIYMSRNKDSTVNSSESMVYGSFPPVSQSTQHEYSARTKEPYPAQSYDIHGKDSSVQLPFQGYPVVQSKNSSSLSSDPAQQDRPYITSRLNENIASVSINNKDTAVQNNQRVEPIVPTQSSASKIDSDHFTQSSSYASFGAKDPKQNIVADSMFQGKRAESYAPYNRDAKKPIFDAANTIAQVSSNKTQLVQNSSVPRYSHQLQQQQSCVATSNYGQSTVSDNLIKSTTTVAHNSSNFSILSWTTFSPISGGGNNNNLVQYEPGADHVDETEGKTICENYSYAPIHKESVSYGNMLPGESFPQDSTIPGVDKARGKLVHDNLKQSFEDPSKIKTVQTAITQQKPSRTHNQAANPEDFKFSAENKNKNSKYPMGGAYTQTEFASIQHNSKTHQTVASKPEKPNYAMPTYDSHASYELAEPNVQIKCNSEIYTGSNYKYGDEKDPNVQLKYQPHVQSQASILHHNNPSYNVAKQTQQQQQQQPQPQQQQQQIANKTKTIAQQQLQQQPIRPPVNWMMTPEIKHNSNIADLILPPIGKELEFCQNNIFTQPPSYNQTTPNHQFYNNYEAVSVPHGFPNITSLQSDPRRIADGFYSEEQPFSWSPTKNSQGIEHNQTIKSIDQHAVVPSTLPTLVGDLALGTNITEKQSFLFGQMPPRGSKELAQPPIKDKETNVGRDYQTMLNTQNVQHSAQGTSFLSVSQLVEHEKAEKSQQQQNHQPHHHHHNHPPQQPQQTRKNQRKTNTSPRGTGKRQIESRKQSNVSDQQLIPQHTEEQKLPTAHTFPDQTYHQQQPQQQKYQQNEVHWRNRHCKSNYTAEALIGGSTSVHDANNQEKQLQTSTIKSFSSDYAQNKYPSGLATTDMVMPPINYLSNAGDEANGYGQVVNQNFNHSSYAYSPNTNIYPTTNFITSISNTPTSYMMPLHENPTEFLETNSFLLANASNAVATSKTTINTSSSVSSSSSTRITSSATVSVAANAKSHPQHYAGSAGKHQNCDKRNSYSTASKKSKRKTDSMHNLDFPLTAVASPLDDYHPHPSHHHHHHHHHHHAHPTTFLAPPHSNPLYQNHTHPSALAVNSNRVTRGANATGHTAALTHHHPSGTSLTNFNLSTIFPEINDKVTGYKPPNAIAPGLPQSSNHATATYPQRANYTTNNALSHLPQVSESTQFTTDLPVPPPPGVVHYKTT